MSDLLIAIVVLAFGSGATLLISRYFHRRSIEKKLTPYLRYGTSVFAGMDPMLRERLKIRYGDVEVEDLIQLEYLVINDGHRPIRDCIEPLTLNLGGGAEVLDARIVEVEPEGRTVDAVVASQSSPARIEFPFQLLNSGEYFVAKLLFRSDVNMADTGFSITADDLPPELETELYPALAYQAHQKEGVEWDSLGFGAGLILAGSSIGYLLTLVLTDRSELIPFIGEAFQPEWLGTSTVILCAIIGVLLIIVGAVGISEAVVSVFRRVSGEPAVNLPRRTVHSPPWVGPFHMDRDSKDQSGPLL